MRKMLVEDKCGKTEKPSEDVHRGEKEPEVLIPSTSKGLFTSNTPDQLEIKHLRRKWEDKSTDEVLKSLGYDVLGHLGKGAYGQVKLATSKKHPNQLAIKIMDCRLMKPRVVSLFLPRELAILRRVRHPHIVEVHDIVKMDYGEVFIVMDAASTTLAEKIEKLGLIPINQAKTWFSQLLSAMVYLHQQDIVHRDLKCPNILLTADDQIKLADFGFACFSKGFPDLSSVYCCTPAYASPEVRRHVPHDVKKADVWTLGVVLYAMVTGKLPIFESDQEDILTVVYPSWIVVDENCRSIISSMLQYSPSARSSMTELQEHPWLRSSEERKAKEKRSEDEKEYVPPVFRELFKPLHNTTEQISIKGSEKVQFVGRFVVVAVENQDGQCISPCDIPLLLEDDGSRAAARVSQSEEVVEEKNGCFRSLCAAVKRAAKARVAAPILRASKSLRMRMRKLFGNKS